MPVYVLVQDKKGVKIKATPDKGMPKGSGSIELVDYSRIRGENVSMKHFITTLSRSVDRPILDKTNYTEPFTFNLQWTVERSSGAAGLGDAAQPDLTRPLLFTAIQEQMGLRFDPQKAPIEVLVIDRVETPSEN
jgi:uncharacterized protein (TIGR03435 family)